VEDSRNLSTNASLKLPFEEFYVAHEARARGWLVKKFQGQGLTPAEAQEVVSEAAWEVAARYEKIENPKAYFYRALANTTYRYLTLKAREREAVDQFLQEAAADRSPRELIRTQQTAEKMNALFRRAKEALTKREQEFLRLVYLPSEPGRPGLTLRELADKWSYSYDYMRQYAVNVRNKLRQTSEIDDDA